MSISFAALIDRKYGKPSETIGHWPLLNKPDAPREPKFKISAEGDRDEFENGLWPYDPQTRFLAMCRIWGTHLLTSSWSECWVKKHSFFMAENYDPYLSYFQSQGETAGFKNQSHHKPPFQPLSSNYWGPLFVQRVVLWSKVQHLARGCHWVCYFQHICHI